MIICEHCFKDHILRATIKKVSTKQGHCPTCNSEDVCLYDTSIQSDLSLMLSELINIYVSNDKFAPNYPEEEKIPSQKISKPVGRSLIIILKPT